MDLSVQAAAAIGAPVVGAIVWLVRLEGRINLHDAALKDVRADLHEIKTDIKTLLSKTR